MAEIEAQRPQREEFERQERQRIEREVREQVERGQREQREQEQERQRQERERQERERAELLEKERREREQAARKPQTVGDIVKDALAADRQRQQEEREWKEKNRSQSSPSVDGIPSLGIPGISGLPGGATIYATESSDELMRRLDEAARAGKRVSISVLDKNGWHKLYTNTGRDKGRGMSASEMQRRFEKYGVPGQEKVGVAGPITTQYEPTGEAGGGDIGGVDVGGGPDFGGGDGDWVGGGEEEEEEDGGFPDDDYYDDYDYYVGDSDGGDDGDTEGYDPGSVSGYQLTVY